MDPFEPSLNDLVFENRIYPCYTIKIFRAEDEVQVHRDRKCLQKFKLSSFPPELDFGKIETVSLLLGIVREQGAAGLLAAYPAIKLAD